MDKEIHFWFNPFYPEGTTIVRYFPTEDAIRVGKSPIHTTQVCLCKGSLFDRGYRIFIHPSDGKTFEIVEGGTAPDGREIKRSHNLFNLLVCGVFDIEDPSGRYLGKEFRRV